MNNFLKATNKAVLEFESILNANNWQDGYGLNESYYKRDNKKPLFFRNSAPALSNKFNVTIQGQSRVVYLMYSVIGNDFKTANDMSYVGGTNVQIAVDIIYDDAFNFMEDASDQTIVDDIYMDFGSNIINKIIESKWAVDTQGESVQSEETIEEQYLNKMSFIINKKF